MNGARGGEKAEARPKPEGMEAQARKTPACPVCGKPAVQEFRPFCSRRCANIDLNRWLAGRYAVPGEPAAAGAAPEAGAEEDEGEGR